MTRHCIDCGVEVTHHSTARCRSCACTHRAAIVHGTRPLSTTVAKRVLTHVSARAGVTVSDLVGRSRARVHTRPRHYAMRLLHRMRYSSVDIGFAFDRDHTTVLSALRAATPLAKAVVK